jgi:ATP-dependent protease ClpP protease subunit
MSEEIKETDKACVIKKNQTAQNFYNVYISGEITEPKDYIELIDLLKSSTEFDTIRVSINSCGGLVNSTIQIITAIQNSKADVTTAIEGEALSAASLIFLSSEQKEVTKGSYMLCHFFYGGAYGKGHEMVSYTDFINQHYYSFFKSIYKGFLTKNEIKQLFNGTDFWFDDKEIKRRLSK